MADQERKASLGFEVDSSGVKPGLDDIKSQVRDMAADVQQSGQRAAKGINAIGDGAPAAAQKVETGARSLIGSIQRTTAAMEAGEKGTAKYYETLAKQRGISAESLKPYLDDLRKAEEAQKRASGSLGSMEMSAKATAAAMRGVPAQFTDIITSLQGGQAPLTVFLQQGGQLKDMFGGAGNAARALGGYVLGLVNPFTIAAAAAGVLALAYSQGSKEADGYRNALILSGNAAGTTSAQLKGYAQDISGIVGTQGKAAESLTAMAASGKISADVLRDAGLAAVQYERATGQAVGKTAEQFASLRNEPLSAVLKLNDGMNFLTESTYRQIKSLEEQGRTAEAARVAQQAYAEALTSRSGEIERNLGSIERGWKAIADAAKKGWDNMLGIGRAQTAQDKLAQVRAEMDAVEKQLGANTGFASTEGGAAYGAGRRALNPAAQQQLRDRLAGLGAEAAALQGVAYAEKTAAEEAATRAEQMRGRAQWDKEGLKYLSDQEKLTRALTEAENEGRSLGASDAEIKQRQADIRAEFAKKATSANQSEIAGIRAKIVAEQEYIDRLRERGVAADKVTEGERLVSKIQEELKGKLDAKTRTLKEQELVEAQRLATLNKVRVSEEQRVKSIADSEAAYRKFLEGIAKGGDAIEQQAIQQEAANASFGKSKTAIAEMTLAQAELAQSMAKDAGPWTPEYIAAMEKAVGAQRRWVRSLQEADFKTVSLHTEELLRNAKEMAALYEDESRLIGLSALERSKVVALRQLELKYAKELDKIEKSGLSDIEKEGQRRRVLEAKQIESQAAVSKVVEEDWNKTSQLIGDTLADYIMGGGKDAAQYLKRLFATLVLQPVVQMGVGTVMGALGVNGSVVGGGSSLLSMGSTAMSGYNLVTGGSSLGGMAGGFMNGLSAWGAEGSVMGMLSNPGLYTGMELLGAVAPILGGVALFASLLSGLDKSGTPHWGAGAIYSADGGLTGGRDAYEHANFYMGTASEYKPEMQSGVDALAKGVVGVLDGFAAAFGNTGGYEVMAAYSDDSSDDPAFGSFRISQAGKDLLNWNDDRADKWAPRHFSDGEAGWTEFTGLAAQGVRDILRGMDLPGWADDLLAGIGDSASMDDLAAVVNKVSAITTGFNAMGAAMDMFTNLSGEMQTSLLNAAGSIEALVSGATAFNNGFYSDAERMAKLNEQLVGVLSGYDLSFDATGGDDAKAKFRAAVEQAMAAGDAEMVAKLLAISGNFASAADYFEQLSQSAAVAAKKAAEDAEKAAAEARRAAIDSAYDLFSRAIDRDRDALTDQASAISDVISQISSSVDLLRSNARELYGTVDSTAQMLAAQGMVYVEDALAGLRAGGSVLDYRGLDDAISAARGGITNGVYTSQFERDRDALVLAGQLAEMGDISDLQLSVEERQLKAINEQIEYLDRLAERADALVNGNVELTDTVDGYFAKLLAILAPEQAPEGAGGTGGSGPVEVVGGSEPGSSKSYRIGEKDADGNWTQQVYLGGHSGYRTSTAEETAHLNEVDGWINKWRGTGDVEGLLLDAKASGYRMIDLATVMGWDYGQLLDRAEDEGIPRFAAGGLHSGGLRVVGERGWELEATGPSRVWNQEQLAQALGGGGNAELVAEVRALREEVAQLRAATAATAVNTAGLPQMVEQFDNVTEGGNAMRGDVLNDKLKVEMA